MAVEVDFMPPPSWDPNGLSAQSVCEANDTNRESAKEEQKILATLPFVAPTEIPAATTLAAEGTSKTTTATQTGQDTPIPVTPPGSAKDVSIEIAQPILAAAIAYRRSTATFPILHQRWFWQQDDSMQFERLQSLFLKLQRLKVPDEDAFNLLARRGLLFWAKAEGAPPSGILNIAQITDIVEVQSTSRATFRYQQNVCYTFEFGSIDLANQFVLGLKQKQDDYVGQEAVIYTSVSFKNAYTALVNGTAFRKANLEIDEQVLSDEETLPPDNEHRPDNKHSLSILSLLKSNPEDHKEASTSTSKKDKRASLLGFLGKRDVTPTPSTEKAETDVRSDLTVVPPIEDASDVIEPVTAADMSSTMDCKVQDKSKVTGTPTKEKVEGFFRNLIRRNDKLEEAFKSDGQKGPAVQHDAVASASLSTPAVEATTAGVLIASQSESSPLVPDQVPAESEERRIPSPSISPRPFIGDNITRRLSGLFKSKSKKEQPKLDVAEGLETGDNQVALVAELSSTAPAAPDSNFKPEEPITELSEHVEPNLLPAVASSRHEAPTSTVTDDLAQVKTEFVAPVTLMAQIGEPKLAPA